MELWRRGHGSGCGTEAWSSVICVLEIPADEIDLSRQTVPLKATGLLSHILSRRLTENTSHLAFEVLRITILEYTPSNQAASCSHSADHETSHTLPGKVTRHGFPESLRHARACHPTGQSMKGLCQNDQTHERRREITDCF